MYMENNSLKKNLGFSAALSTLIGGVIGSGVFFKPQVIFTATGGAPGLGIWGWIVAGIITIAAGLTVAELAVVIPKTGGMMIYMKDIYGDKVGFISGWVQSVLFFPGIIAALAVIFADQFVVLSGMNSLKIPVALFTIAILSYLNSLGSKSGSGIQIISTLCKIAVLAVVIVLGFALGKGGNPVMSPLVAEGVSPVSSMGKILIAIFFAFDGWINVTALAGEMKDPGKDLPRAIVGGLSIVAAIYLIINVSYLWVVPADVLANSVSPATTVANTILGPVGGTIIGIGIMISVFGAVNAYIFTGSRVLYALAQDSHLPKGAFLSQVNKNNVPGKSLLGTCIISCIYALSGQFNLLTDFAVFAIWIFIVLSFFGVIILRKRKPELERSYRVPLYPITPIIAIIGGSFVLFNQLFTSTLLAVGGIVIMLIGLPIYIIMDKKINQ